MKLRSNLPLKSDRPTAVEKFEFPARLRSIVKRGREMAVQDAITRSDTPDQSYRWHDDLPADMMI